MEASSSFETIASRNCCSARISRSRKVAFMEDRDGGVREVQPAVAVAVLVDNSLLHKHNGTLKIFTAQTWAHSSLVSKFPMSRLFSHSLLRDIFDISREIRMLTSPDSPSCSSENRDILPLRLPDVRTPAQDLIDLGLGPVLARRFSGVYMDFVARHRQVFELYFRRVIHGGCRHPEYYRVIFVAQFKSTIQACESRIMSTARVWLSQAVPYPTSFSLEVRTPGYAIFFTHLIYLWFQARVDAAMKTQVLSGLDRVITSFSNNTVCLLPTTFSELLPDL